MLDTKFLKSETDYIKAKLFEQGFELDADSLHSLSEEVSLLQVATEKLQQARNASAKQVGQAKAKGEDVTELLKSVADIGDELAAKEHALHEAKERWQALIATIPNVQHDSVPAGTSEADNQEVRTWGSIPKFDFDVHDHSDVAEALGLLDFSSAAKISGARFSVMYADLAKLHRALIQFMLELHTKEHGYTEVYVPYLVKQESLFGTGQLPKFHEDQFNIGGDSDLSLIPTAEVPVTNLVRDSIITGETLPLKYVAHTPCFRSEAGSYGKDTKGMIRQHQFEKVELVQIVRPEDSYQVHEELTAHAEAILQRLELPYRVVNLCAGDLGFSAAKTYDLEVWLPSQNTYREISSCSNFESFQARRMKARFKDSTMKKADLVHTLNGSALAVGRTLVAILENYQQKDGSVAIPKALLPFMGGLTHLSK